MKKIFITTLLLGTGVYAEMLDSAKISNMISKIKEERRGIRIKKLESIVTPFIMNVQKESEQKVEKRVEKKATVKKVISQPSYQLTAVLNHAAFINKKWHKVGDKLGSYKVSSMTPTSVTLKRQGGTKILYIKKRKKNFIQLNQGNK